MSIKIITLIMAALILSIFMGTLAFAECREGKSIVTIVTPVGKSIEICVADEAIDQIGGLGDLVIPAVCPCFSPEDIDCLASEVMYASQCIDIPGDRTFMDGVIDPRWPWTAYVDVLEEFCYIAVPKPGECQRGKIAHHISEDEYEACRYVLLNSDMWAFHCDGS